MDDRPEAPGPEREQPQGDRPYAPTSHSPTQPEHRSNPGGGVYATREDRQKRMLQIAQVLVLVFGIFLILMGGIGSLSRERLEEIHFEGKFISPTINHHYATAAHNLLLGLLFIVCSIGLYVPVFWSRKATFGACIVYVANTVALTTWEHVVRMGRGEAIVFESFSDIIFWSVVPVIIVVLLLVAVSGATRRAESPEAAA